MSRRRRRLAFEIPNDAFLQYDHACQGAAFTGSRTPPFPRPLFSCLYLAFPAGQILPQILLPQFSTAATAVRPPFGAQLINALRVHTPSYGCARATQRATNGIRNLFPLGNAMGQYKRFARALKLVCRSQRNKHSVGLPIVSTRAGRELLLRDFNRWA